MKTFFITKTLEDRKPIIIASYSTYEEAQERMIKMFKSFVGTKATEEAFLKGGEDPESFVKWDSESIVDYKTTYKIVEKKNGDFGIDYKISKFEKHHDIYAGFNSYADAIEFADLFERSEIELYELRGDDLIPSHLNYDGSLEDLGSQFTKDNVDYVVGVKIWNISLI